MTLRAKFFVFFALLTVISSSQSFAESDDYRLPPTSVDNNSSEIEVAQQVQPNPNTHSIGHMILFYIPNRLLDVLDIFRVRVRVGPGVAASVRATKPLSAFVGTYASLYAGLPGPRLRPAPRSPIGLESENGVSLSVLDATADAGMGPRYSDTELGVGVQAAIVGFDIGIDPVEIVDLLLGIFTIDIRDDDL